MLLFTTPLTCTRRTKHAGKTITTKNPVFRFIHDILKAYVFVAEKVYELSEKIRTVKFESL